MATLKNTTINNTEVFNLPTGTPAVPQTGMIRYNTSTGRIEYYNNSWLILTDPDVSGGTIYNINLNNNSVNIHVFGQGSDTFIVN
jgi:hypothetical protein